MDNKKIVCYFSLFSLTPKILLIEGENKNKILPASSIANLDTELASYAQQYDIKDIHLYGASTFGEGLKQKIQAKAITNYNLNNLTISLN